MDELKVIYALIFTFAVSCFSVVCVMNVHNEKMADKGFCKVMLIGSENGAWAKCK